LRTVGGFYRLSRRGAAREGELPVSKKRVAISYLSPGVHPYVQWRIRPAKKVSVVEAAFDEDPIKLGK